MVPAKGKNKKGKAGKGQTNRDHPPLPRPLPEDKPKPIPKKPDPELLQLEIKRKAVLTKNKWCTTITEFGQEVHMALSRANKYPECEEWLGFRKG